MGTVAYISMHKPRASTHVVFSFLQKRILGTLHALLARASNSNHAHLYCSLSLYRSNWSGSPLSCGSNVQSAMRRSMPEQTEQQSRLFMCLHACGVLKIQSHTNGKRML